MSNKFNYDLDFDAVDFRDHPELYRIGVGEQGVLLVEPYKSELLPLWRFKTEEIATHSAEQLYEKFEEYLNNKDFVGADMARKYIQMGFTRARRYANHPSGRKYAAGDDPDHEQKAYPYSSGSPRKGNEVLPRAKDAAISEKAKAAAVFKSYWDRCRAHPEYQQQKEAFRKKYY
ncbi:DUF4385 domain-containing protein [Persicitalea jodogahamensis]|uniref:DUF4385 domain-containing protein n=1 Tax=Persicitalea jodogahamensis TaxID=402147 RepID=A0A8J3D696_9BACT|nr:DUF4385 domain-containing protein [Persicitalea jodogahamensis]GHB80686.1 hypothetical protein GCM10007390_38900 [Persicitalea jodogahamensis]